MLADVSDAVGAPEPHRVVQTRLIDSESLRRERAAKSGSEGGRKLRRRAVIERKIDHMQDLGANKARYRGRRKTKLQILLAATVANLARLEALGGLGDNDAIDPRHKSHRDRVHKLLGTPIRPGNDAVAAIKTLFRPIRWDLRRGLHPISDPLSCSRT